MAHTKHPDTRGDMTWRSLAEQLGFDCVDDLLTFLDVAPYHMARIDVTDIVPEHVESVARVACDIVSELLGSVEAPREARGA